MNNSYANDGTPLAYVLYDEKPSKNTCMANVGDDNHYESCGENLRSLKDGTYKCRTHGIMLA